jgi:hypothetical protein
MIMIYEEKCKSFERSKCFIGSDGYPLFPLAETL